MKSYEEIDHQNDQAPVWTIFAFLLIIALVVFCIHLMLRHNKLHEQYTSCMQTVQLFSNWKESQR